MDELENNRVRAILTQSRPNIPPELQQRLNPTVVDRARLPSGNVPDEIKQRFISNNAAQQSEALNRANATTADATKSPSRIGNFFNKLNDPLVTREGAANAAQKTVNTAKSVGNAVIESPKTATLLKGAARAGGAIQAFNAGNELVNGNGSALEKADSAINLGLGVGTTANPIVGLPNLAYQAAKAGGGLIAEFANNQGLLDQFKPTEQAQTPGFEAAKKKFLESKVAPKVTAAPAAPAGNPAPPNEKPFGFENLSAKEQAAIVKDAQKSGATSANLQLQGANGKINNSVLAVPKAQATGGRKNPNIIQAAFKPQTNKAEQNQAQEVQPVQQAPVRPQFSEEDLANTPRKVLDNSGATFDPSTKKYINGASVYEYPDGRQVVLPIKAKLDDSVLPGYSRFKQLADFDNAQQAIQNANLPTIQGLRNATIVNDGNGITEFNKQLVTGYDENGQFVQQELQRAPDETGLTERQAQLLRPFRNKVTGEIDRELLKAGAQLTADSTSAADNATDIQREGMSQSGQNGRNASNSALDNQKRNLISEYFSSNTSAERKAELAPYVTGGEKSSKGFSTFKETDSLGNEKTYRMNENNGEISEAKPAAATAKKPTEKEFITKGKVANPNASVAELKEFYKNKYGK